MEGKRTQSHKPLKDLFLVSNFCRNQSLTKYTFNTYLSATLDGVTYLLSRTFKEVKKEQEELKQNKY